MANGLLDYFATPAGQGLLSGIAGYAATARRGTPINNLGRGLASGVAGYNSVLDQRRADEESKTNKAYKDAMMQSALMNAQSSQLRLAQEAENNRKKQELIGRGKDDFTGTLKAIYPGTDFNVDYDDDEGYRIGGFRKVGTADTGEAIMSDMTKDNVIGEFDIREQQPLDLLKMQQDRQQQPQAYQDQGMPKPQPKPLQLVTPQQELQATRESYRRLLGYTPEAWQDVMNLPAEQGAELIGRQFNALKAPGLKGKTGGEKINFEDAMILRSQGVDVPGYERYTPEIAIGFMGKKNEGRRAGATNVALYPEDTIKHESTLRKEFSDTIEAKAFPKVQSAFDQISYAAKNPSAASDLALATKFMKMLDPESVVRESELAMAMEASGYLDRMANYHKRLLAGEKLTPSQREDFLKVATGLYDAARERHNEKAEAYRSFATDYKMNPDRIAKPVQSAPKTQQPGTKPLSKFIKLDDGSNVTAKLGSDGNYWVMKNGKSYIVE